MLYFCSKYYLMKKIDTMTVKGTTALLVEVTSPSKQTRSTMCRLKLNENNFVGKTYKIMDLWKDISLLHQKN